LKAIAATLCLTAALGATSPVAAQIQPVLRFGAWEIRHFHDFDGGDSARASLLTDAGFISVECRRPGPETLMVTWHPTGRLGSPDDYTPREISVQWDGEAPQVQPWEAFVGAAFQRDHARASAFAAELPSHGRLTLSGVDDRGVRRECRFDLGLAADTSAAMRQVVRDCLEGWH
jgi:hypothetical protein